MKKRTLRSRHIALMIMLTAVTGACTQHRLADVPNVIANDRPEVIHVQARIPGDYGLSLPHERKIFFEREIVRPRLVGDTISGLHNGRLVKIPLARVTRVRVPRHSEDVVKVTKVRAPGQSEEVGKAGKALAKGLGFFGRLLIKAMLCRYGCP